MKKKEVPQDEGLMEGRFEDLNYALDENGNYVTVLSKGWAPKNEAMLQAWDLIHEKTEQVRQDVLAGKISPIAFFMEKNIMSLKLLADYVELPKRKVRKHLKPEKFTQLEDDILQRYADTFEITLEQLKKFRETLTKP
jgi:hypothetical protein